MGLRIDGNRREQGLMHCCGMTRRKVDLSLDRTLQASFAGQRRACFRWRPSSKPRSRFEGYSRSTVLRPRCHCRVRGFIPRIVYVRPTPVLRRVAMLDSPIPALGPLHGEGRADRSPRSSVEAGADQREVFAGDARPSPCNLHHGHSVEAAHEIASGFVHRKIVAAPAVHARSVLDCPPMSSRISLVHCTRWQRFLVVTNARGTHKACTPQ